MRIRNLDLATVVAAAAFIAAPGTAAPVPASIDADGRALVLVPLTLVKIDDLNFGTVVRSSAPGTVTINPSTGARTLAGGVTGVTSDPGHRAYFAGAGTPSQQVLLAISPPVALASASGDTIPVTGLTLDGPPIRTIDPITRAFYVGVGGTIQVAADQPEGVYNADFWLTAIYQ
ncbi:MAG TPA: DUF4402 domain-containing protein [Sphingomicrobium sp.]|nr:DUF4402 domain-containing protein [Sphingomicrobium sp.]